ncbi:MAG TPA: PhoU domain-containing protein [Terriglobales bacterium]|nr:PhoU domain-containing protein [Terriglobales bacterium]
MSTASNKQPEMDYRGVVNLTIRACQIAQAAASASAQAVANGSPDILDNVREREEELDTLDREINEGVTALITQVPPQEARELLACLKLVIELERIGDLLLGFSNRLRSCVSRLDRQDVRDLASMAATVERMVRDGEQAFEKRDTNLAVAVLRADAEVDRLRNLIVVRHIENPEGERRQESFHVVFMSQALERAGDHVKNMAEEVVHLVTGRSVRHLLRAADKPFENMFVEYMRRRDAFKR